MYRDMAKPRKIYSQNSSGDKMPQIQVEIMIFFSAVLSGAVLRAVYRGIGCVREWIPHRAAVIELEDLLYWLAAALYLFVQIYHTSNGSIRWYFILGVVVGAVFASFLFRRMKRIHKKIYGERHKEFMKTP